ncbi:hypothetical protein QFC21_005105 [Naganishia friedmannii]|uniref:Uncharacterized protein n=1 Tax=Naganishia friedmannii TaxID=89922 RepID=A0ACC2VBS4_9TREE|nr:hypothetical protein QFC21_005105 [Naganishia friedmannii]
MRASAAERRREATTSAAAGDPALVSSLSAADGRGKGEEEDAAGGRLPSLRADHEHGWQQQQRDPTEMFGMTPTPAVALDVVLDESARFAPARFPYAVRVAGMMQASTADNDDEKDEEQEDQKKPGWWEATPDMTDAVAPPSHTTYVETERFMMPFPAAAAAVHPPTWTIDPIPTPTPTTTRPPPTKTGENSGVRLPSHSFSRNVDLCAGGAAAIQEQACAAALGQRGDRSAAGFGSGGHGRGISRTMVLASSGEGDDPWGFIWLTLPVVGDDED